MRTGTQVALLVIVMGAALGGGLFVRRAMRAAQSPRLLVIAAQRGDLEKLQLALDGGVDIDAIPDGTRGAPAISALEAAASNGHVDAVDLLLESGADPQPVLTAGWEVVEDAAWQAQRQVTDALLDAGAHPDVPDEHGNTAVHNAVLLGARDVIARLLERGASADAPNKAGLLPVHLAIKLDEPQTVRLIAKHMRKPDPFAAVVLGELEALSDLLRANPTWVDESPPPLTDYGLLHLAARGGATAIAEYLLQLTQDVDRAEASSGRAALHWAAEDGHVPVIDLLVTHGAALEAQAGGRTPLDLACLAGQAPAAERLLDAGAKPNPNLAPLIQQFPRERYHEGHDRVLELLRGE